MSYGANVSTIAVIGSGYMGGGIAMVFALGGHVVTLADADASIAERARVRLTGEADEFESQGLLDVGSAQKVRENLVAATSIERAVTGADYITEAVPEQVELKIDILRQISGAARVDAIIATNTSAIPISELAAVVTNAERFLGVHWMNPAPFIPGVELIPGPATTSRTLDIANSLMRSVGKIPVCVADTPGFVANRLQFALFKEALRIVEEGTATPEQIDVVVSNTFGFRLALFGPFAIGDMAGLDVYESSFRSLENAYGDRFSVPPSLAATVAKGNLGLKSGKGILDIDIADHNSLRAYRARAYAGLSQLRAELGKAPGL